MRTNYRVNSGVRFNMLSKEQLEELYQGVLHVLEYTGLEVHHEESRDILKKAGAWVDGLRVRIPSWLVKRSLEMAPLSFTLFARDGNPGWAAYESNARTTRIFGPNCRTESAPLELERAAWEQVPDRYLGSL